MAIPEQKRSGTILFWGAGMLVAVIIFFAVRSLTRPEVIVRVVPVTRQTLLDTVSTNGKVEPVTEFQAHAPGPGVISRIYVEVDQHVASGTLLISMKDDDAVARVATAKAAVSGAQLTLHDLERGGSADEQGRFKNDTAAARLDQQSADTNLAQVKALQQRGSASAAEVASAQSRADSANLALRTASGRGVGRYTAEDIANARAHVVDAQAGLAAAQAQLAALNIRTPIAGTVYSIPFSQYDYVNSGADDMLAIADLNHVRVRAYFDEPDIGRLQRGQAVTITWEAKRGVTWHGHVEIAPTTVVPYGTRSVGECIITVDDAHGTLLPNTNVNINVTRAQRFNVLGIPREALHTDGPDKFVFRIVGGKLLRTPVTTDVVNTTSVQITSGLKDGDIIVLGPAVFGTDLSDGMKVKQIQ